MLFCFIQIRAEIDVINASWDEKGNNKNLADSIGLMVYEGTNSLNYVKNYVAGTSRWDEKTLSLQTPIEFNKKDSTDKILLF